MTVYRGEGEGEGDHGTIMATPFSFCTSDVELADGEFVSYLSVSSRCIYLSIYLCVRGGGGPHQTYFLGRRRALQTTPSRTLSR
jgi:hypothetical protein